MDDLLKENQSLKQEVERLKRKVCELHAKLMAIYRDNARQAKWDMDYLPPPEEEREN